MLSRLFQQMVSGGTSAPAKPPLPQPVSPISGYAQHTGFALRVPQRLNTYPALEGIDAVESAYGEVNPFAMAGRPASSVLNKRLPADFGVNKPLQKPIFLGYHKDKALLCGQHLYISC